MEYLKAFLVGGAICGVVQILMDNTKLMPGRIMVILVCSGAILSAIGLYKPFLEWAGAGAGVPLSGFGHLLYDGVKKSVDKEGFIGIFKGGFTASAVGISGALIFSYMASWFFESKI
ncbi:MAG TPA: stage V sporulation protein AE [Clostridiales bacterium]|nr:stage V sporulation protein AE [Clostridiales bacterium]